ncbi:hypothetical protein [Nocardioides bruguierae]|uniref:Uncharacterized protein n=1 Tax=Nocardioides bruguierae TaxID=2945102 RepID=A0A9X2D6L7_9ACTN|nr:hypothetical protein [Nocardioides bruguierae]MCM0619802.1 hypothetical protein [Nocardioides bruguierae]
MTLNPIAAHRRRITERCQVAYSQAMADASQALRDRIPLEHGTPGAAHRRRALQEAAEQLSAEAKAPRQSSTTDQEADRG